MAFIMLKCSQYTNFLKRFFIRSRHWILSKAFSASIEIIIWYSFFILLMWFITLIALWILNHQFFPTWLSVKLNGASFLDSEVAVKMFCGGTKGEISITDILAPYTIMWILSDTIDILSIVYQMMYLIAKKNDDNDLQKLASSSSEMCGTTCVPKLPVGSGWSWLSWDPMFLAPPPSLWYFLPFSWVLSLSHSVVSDSLWPCGLEPARLLSMGFSREEY